jgi:hypothetical protein
VGGDDFDLLIAPARDNPSRPVTAGTRCYMRVPAGVLQARPDSRGRHFELGIALQFIPPAKPTETLGEQVSSTIGDDDQKQVFPSLVTSRALVQLHAAHCSVAPSTAHILVPEESQQYPGF